MNVFRNEQPAMALNNPGHLLTAYGMQYPTQLKNGFAQFRSMADGLEALCAFVFDHFEYRGKRTLPAIVAELVKGRSLDAVAYESELLKLLNRSPLQVITQELRLDRSYDAMMFIRAVIIVENGVPPSSWLPSGEWIDLTTWVAAMNRCARWKVV
jgi:hypothetical protein